MSDISSFTFIYTDSYIKEVCMLCQKSILCYIKKVLHIILFLAVKVNYLNYFIEAL